MVYLGSQGVVHGDLGARNALAFDVGGRITACISDFGLSVVCDRGALAADDDAGDHKGTGAQYHRIPTFESRPIPIKYSPPEVIDDKRYSRESDVWSFGVLAWEIFSDGAKPFREVSNSQVIHGVAHGEIRLPRPDSCSREHYMLLSRCWNRIPSGRPSFEELHREFNSPTPLESTRSRHTSDEDSMLDTDSDTEDDDYDEDGYQNTSSNRPKKPTEPGTPPDGYQCT